MVASIVVPMSFVGMDSLDKTRSVSCSEIFHFKIVTSYFLSCLLFDLDSGGVPTMVITHFLLAPCTISHLQVLLPPSSMREIPYQTPISSLPISTLIAHILSLFSDLLFLSAYFLIVV